MNPIESLITFVFGGIQGLLKIIPTVAIIAIFAGYIVGYSFIIYHLLRFGIGFIPKILAAAFTVISIILLGLLLRQYMLIDFIELFRQIAGIFNITTP